MSSGHSPIHSKARGTVRGLCIPYMAAQYAFLMAPISNHLLVWNLSGFSFFNFNLLFFGITHSRTPLLTYFHNYQLIYHNMSAQNNKDGTSFASSDSESDKSWTEVSKPQVLRIKPKVQAPDEPWQYTPAAKSIQLPDASGHTTTLAFEVETKTNYKGC